MERYISVDSGKSGTKISVLKSTGIVNMKFLTKVDEVNELESPEEDTYIVEIDGRYFRVGDNAIHTAPKDTSKKSDFHRIATWTAVALNCDSGDVVNMAIGCPLSLYESSVQRTRYKNYMLPVNESITVRIKSVNGTQTKSFSFGKRGVFPEGSGLIYFDPTQYAKKMIAIIDIGGLNMNAGLYDNLKLLHDMIVTRELGGRVLIDELTDALNAEYNASVTSKLVENKIFNKDKTQRFIVSSDDPIKSKTESPAFIHTFILNHIKSIYKSVKEAGIDPLNVSLYFIGGTSELLEEEIKEVFVDPKFVESVFVNSEGWLRMLCRLCQVPF